MNLPVAQARAAVHKRAGARPQPVPWTTASGSSPDPDLALRAAGAHGRFWGLSTMHTVGLLFVLLGLPVGPPLPLERSRETSHVPNICWDLDLQSLQNITL